MPTFHSDAGVWAPAAPDMAMSSAREKMAQRGTSGSRLIIRQSGWREPDEIVEEDKQH